MSEVGARVQEIFQKMPETLNPSAAAGVDATIQFDLGGDAAAQYNCTIANGSCTVAEGNSDAPTMTVTMDAADYVDMVDGKLDGMSAFMSGKLKIGGDMGLAMKLQSLFSGA